MSSTSRSRPVIIAAVMASMCMIAIEATIVSTVMPQIAAELGDLNLYAWVFASFLLTQTAMTVVFGKLADQFGRKPTMLAGIVIFLIGSVAAGFAWSMPSMIAFRLIQGIGAGAVQPVAMTIVADLYPARERGKVQGYLASVWAISAVIGPMVGALIVDSFSWEWIFWMNIPVGIASAIGFAKFLEEPPRKSRPSIDVAGATLFTAAVATLMIALTDAGTGHDTRVWTSAVLCCVFLALFVWQERRAPEPMISFPLWARRPIATTNGAMFLSNGIIMGLTTFLPIYVQGVLHRTPVVAGLALTMIMLGWPLGGITAARIFTRFGLRSIIIAGSLFCPVGMAMLVTLGPGSSAIVAGAGSLIMGFGMGLMTVPSMVLIQESVDAASRGVATASNIFARNLGGTIGTAALGAIFSHGLSHAEGGAVTSEQLRQVLEATPGATAVLADPSIERTLQHALHGTFIAMLIASLLAIVFAWMVPSVHLGRRRPPADAGPSIGH